MSFLTLFASMMCLPHVYFLGNYVYTHIYIYTCTYVCVQTHIHTQSILIIQTQYLSNCFSTTNEWASFLHDILNFFWIFCQNQLTRSVWVCIWAFCCVPLISGSVLWPKSGAVFICFCLHSWVSEMSNHTTSSVNWDKIKLNKNVKKWWCMKVNYIKEVDKYKTYLTLKTIFLRCS